MNTTRSLSTTMTWEQAEARIHANPLALPSVKQALNPVVPDHSKALVITFLVAAILYAVIFTVLCVKYPEEMGFFVSPNHVDDRANIFCILACFSPVILLYCAIKSVHEHYADGKKNRETQQRIDTDRTTNDHPFLAQLLNKDLESMERTRIYRQTTMHQLRTQEEDVELIRITLPQPTVHV